MWWRRVARWRGARRRARGSPLRVGQRGPVTVTHAHRRPLRPTRGLPSQVTTEIPILTGGNRPGRPAAGPPGRGATSDASGTAAHAGAGPLRPPRGPGLPRAPTEPCSPLARICGRSPEAAGAVFHATERENAPARRGGARFAGPLGPLRLCSSLRGTCRCPADSTDLAAGAARPPVGQRLPLAPARGTAAPRAARPLFRCFSPHTSELARQHRIHLTFKITESGHDAPARKLRTLPARQCGVRPPGVGGCH